MTLCWLCKCEQAFLKFCGSFGRLESNSSLGVNRFPRALAPRNEEGEETGRRRVVCAHITLDSRQNDGGTAFLNFKFQVS